MGCLILIFQRKGCISEWGNGHCSSKKVCDIAEHTVQSGSGYMGQGMGAGDMGVHNSNVDLGITII